MSINILLDKVHVQCSKCSAYHLIKDWYLARTMIEEQFGHSAYRYVYLCEISCDCGLQLVVEAQGFQPSDELFVDHWHYRFFDCEEVLIEPMSLN